MIMRILGSILGIVWVIGGPIIVFALEDDSLLRLIYSLGFVGTGAYFLNYAITGRSTFRKRPK